MIHLREEMILPACKFSGFCYFFDVSSRNGVDLGPRFFCGNTSSPQNFDIDLSNEENKRITINRYG